MSYAVSTIPASPSSSVDPAPPPPSSTKIKRRRKEHTETTQAVIERSRGANGTTIEPFREILSLPGVPTKDQPRQAVLPEVGLYALRSPIRGVASPPAELSPPPQLNQGETTLQGSAPTWTSTSARFFGVIRGLTPQQAGRPCRARTSVACSPTSMQQGELNPALEEGLNEATGLRPSRGLRPTTAELRLTSTLRTTFLLPRRETTRRRMLLLQRQLKPSMTPWMTKTRGAMPLPLLRLLESRLPSPIGSELVFTN